MHTLDARVIYKDRDANIISHDRTNREASEQKLKWNEKTNKTAYRWLKFQIKT